VLQSDAEETRTIRDSESRQAAFLRFGFYFGFIPIILVILFAHHPTAASAIGGTAALAFVAWGVAHCLRVCLLVSATGLVVRNPIRTYCLEWSDVTSFCRWRLQDLRGAAGVRTPVGAVDQDQ
jgi:hypothetical protein